MDEHLFKNPTRRSLDFGGHRRTLPRLAVGLARTRRLLLATLMVATVLLPHAPFVEARVVQDARCSANSATFLLGSKAYSQTFTAQHTGKLISGFVQTYNVQDAPATYVVELWDADVFGLPTGTGPLASTTAGHPGKGYGGENPVFATPAKVRNGETYALVVRVPDPTIHGVTVLSNAACDTFAVSNGGAFQVDTNNRDLWFAVNVKVRRHHRR